MSASALLPEPFALMGRSLRLLGMWQSSHTVDVGGPLYLYSVARVWEDGYL